MRNLTVAVLASLALAPSSVAVAASGAHDACAPINQRHRPFTMELPRDFDVRVSMTGEDFVTYEIYRGGVAYVGLYVGDHGWFGRPSDSAPWRPDPANGRHIRIDTKGGGERIAGYSVASNCPDGPGLIEAWAFNVPGDQATADRMAASVRARRAAPTR